MNHGTTPSAGFDVKVRPASLPPASADAVLAELRRRLLRFAVKLVWSRPDAEEIVQEAFRISLTKGPRLPFERYQPWMFRTVANLCLNFRRRRKPEPLADWIEDTQPMAPDARMQRAEQLDDLRKAVARLPEQRRTALVLRTMERMSYTDVAEIMALSVAAVRSHVHFARQQLAEWLGAGTGEEPS